MTDPHRISAETILAALPEVLARDEVSHALAAAVAAELNEAVCKTSLALIYANIDALEEPLLDILARDFKIDWWPADASVEEKRRTLKSSWYVHRRLGTPAAVEDVIAGYIGQGKLEEWYEYGGIPGHYRITGGNNDAIIEHYDEFAAVLAVVTRGSAVLDKIQALVTREQRIGVGLATMIRVEKTVECEVPSYDSWTLLLDENDNVLTTEHDEPLTL